MNLPPTPHPQPSHDLDYPTVWIMILGLIIAIGPLSIDMYLPALPSMAKDFGVATAFMSNSVPAYFVGLVSGNCFMVRFPIGLGALSPCMWAWYCM